MRVDLTDVERVVRSHLQVTDVVVLPVPADDGQFDLLAFAVPSDGSVDESAPAESFGGDQVDLEPDAPA